MSRIPKANTWIFYLLCLVTAMAFNGIYAQPIPLPRFKNFSSSAFSGNEVKSVLMASNGSIWVATGKGLFVVNGGQVSEQPLPASVNKNLNSLLEHNGTMYAGCNNGVIGVDIKTRITEMLPVLKIGGRMVEKYCMVTDVNAGNELLFYTGYDTSAYFAYHLTKKTTRYLFNKSDGYRAYQKDSLGRLVKLWAVEASGLLEHQMDGFRLINLERIFLGQNGQPLLKFGNAALDAGGTLWCTTDKGLLAYETGSRQFKLLKMPRNEALTDVVVNGALVYCATRQNGILIYNKELQTFTGHFQHTPDDPWSLLSGEVYKLLIANGLLVAVTSKGISCLPLHPALQMVNRYSFSLGKNTPAIFKMDGEDLLVAGGLMVKRFSATWVQQQSILLDAPGETITSLLPLPNGVIATTQTRIFFCSNNGVKEIKPIDPAKKARSLLFATRLRGDDVLLAGGDEGLYEVDLPSGIYRPFAATAADNYQQFQYAFTVGKHLIVSTYYSYLKMLSVENGSYKASAEIETFANIYDHLLADSSNVLLATSGGLAIFNIDNASFNKISPAFTKAVYGIRVVGADTMLITEAGLYRYAGRLVLPSNYPLNTLVKPASANRFVSTPNELKIFDDTFFVQLPWNAAQLVSLNKRWMDVQPEKADNDDVVRLNASEKKWQIDISLNNYHPFIEASWQYQLAPADTGWQTGETNHLQFENLAPGNYQLKIAAFSAGESWYSRQIAVERSPAWYQTDLFKILLIAISAVFFWLLYRFSIGRFKKKAREKEALRQRILELESKAFRAQMNPHFVFNTLNSINSCILEKETDKASDFLTQFSRLIRLTLDNSNQDLILLEKELETVRLYLSIEQKRLENAFVFDIKTDQALKGEEWKVPPMIIQPFIENAIWHGLVHKQSNGTINISVILADDRLQINIQDNGIGRRQAALLQSGRKLHNSLGTTLTLQRLQVYHPNNSIAFADLAAGDGIEAGTMVQLTIYPIDI